MRGLIKKDFYCLRKSMKLILLVALGTIYLAVTFTLSARYGNVAKNISETAETAARARAEELLTEEEFYSIYTYVIWVVLLLPLALMGNVVDCFREDRRAGFGKFCFSLPAREKQIAGARYLSCLLYSCWGSSLPSRLPSACPWHRTGCGFRSFCPWSLPLAASCWCSCRWSCP